MVDIARSLDGREIHSRVANAEARAGRQQWVVIVRASSYFYGTVDRPLGYVIARADCAKLLYESHDATRYSLRTKGTSNVESQSLVEGK